MRDMYTHKITTPKHWNMLMLGPAVYTSEELDYDLVVGNDTVVTKSYDPNCENGNVSGGCEPVAVISGEKLRDYTEGPAETAAIANVLHNDERTGQYVIDQEAWDCIWSELIEKGKGIKTVYDRPGGYTEEEYSFSEEMLDAMIYELDRLITKYGGADWNTKASANRLVELLAEHRTLIANELSDVKAAGVRNLANTNFLGPKERDDRNAIRMAQGEAVEEQKDYSKYFMAIEKKMTEYKHKDMKRVFREVDRKSNRAA